MITLTIDGDRITDIPSFYDEINRVFMADEDWALGESLDALNDMLYGSFGAATAEQPLIWVWKNIAQSREVLGVETTRAWYADKLAQPGRFNVRQIKRDLALLESGEGPTYFEIVLEVIADHPRIRLVDERGQAVALPATSG
ncbi:barstar family protein [Paracoccus caeni]|uniref:Barstar family protein n=1 Tax=Paracoccus caeni TaxID=657651 RepID=A0A934SM23_9RHOB|nr:barstar family protein [Paracoccus caeni]MBK4216838.1 barstar family protein [Paracoccus caeni]